jgi:hypothetical protein
MARRLPNRPPLPPFTGNALKTALCLPLSRFRLSLFGLALCLAFGHRINPGVQRFARYQVTFPDFLESDEWVFPQSHHLFLAIEAIAPEFGAGWCDEQTQPATIRQFVRLTIWLCDFDLFNRESHWLAPKRRHSFRTHRTYPIYPQWYPQKRLAPGARPQTPLDGTFAKLLFF